MRLFTLALTVLAGALLMSGCSRPAPPPTPPAAVDTAEAVAAIRTAEATWNADWAARDAARIAAHYAPDAILMSPGAPPAQGTRAITELVRAALADPAFGISFTADNVVVAASGDVGWTTGTFTLHQTSQATHRPETVTGRYVTTYRRIGGAWLAVHDINTPEPAMPPY